MLETNGKVWLTVAKVGTVIFNQIIAVASASV